MNVLALIYQILFRAHVKQRGKELKKEFNLDASVRLNYPENIFLHGNIGIGKHTYINGARITSGTDSKVVIGQWCAIGHNVNILAWSHDPQKATGDETERPAIQKDIVIGDHVWIGTNVLIREGVSIGSGSIVGANSVVTRSFPDKSVIAGCPARLIRKLE